MVSIYSVIINLFSTPDMKNSIRVERAKIRISQEELAEAVNATRQSIHLIENGKTEPKLSMALKISQYFGVKIEDLFQAEVENLKVEQSN
jgi:putative transcriptional regulator